MADTQPPGQPIRMSGTMAAGKNRVAQALSELSECRPRGVPLRGDPFRRLIVQVRFGPAAHTGPGATAQLHLRCQIAASGARRYAGAGCTLVDLNVLLETNLPWIMRTRRPHDLQLTVLWAGTVARREAARDQTGDGGWTVLALDADLQRTPGLGPWPDSAGPSVDETAHAVLTRLGAARV